MTKHVKCIKGGYQRITVGKIYAVIKFIPGMDRGGSYEVTTNDIAPGIYYADNFEPVQCPCNIKGCLKHRAQS